MKSKFLLPFLVFLLLAACTASELSTEPVPTEPALTESVVTVAPEPTATYEPYHIKMPSYPYITDAPYFIAVEEGYFAEQGLDVEFIRFERATDALPALLSGDLDASSVMPTPSLLNAIVGGGELKIVAGKGYFDPSACAYSGLMVLPELIESGRLDNPADWVGLRIATERMAATEYAIDMLLQQNGLTLDDIEIVDLPITSRLDALKNGAIDVASAGEPWVSRLAGSGAVVWQSYTSILPNYAFGNVAFGPSLLTEHPDVGQRFMIAFLKGLAQYNEGKTPRNLEIISKYTQLTPDEIEQTCWQLMKSDGSLDKNSILDYQEWAIEKGYMESPATEEQIFDFSFLEYALSFVP